LFILRSMGSDASPSKPQRRPAQSTQRAGEPLSGRKSSYLLRLSELELLDRERRLIERRIRQARFPAVKSLDSFDFAAIPSLNKLLVLELARCSYVVQRENVIALGNGEPASYCRVSGI